MSLMSNDIQMPAPEHENTYDLIIVGGGISGLYCLHNLKEEYKKKNMKIGLFESSNRLGGKIESLRFKSNDYKSKSQTSSLEEIKESSEETLQSMIDNDAKVRSKLNEEKSKTESKEKKDLREILGGKYIEHMEQLNDQLVAEFGPMRIEPDHQPYLKTLLDHLNILEEDQLRPTWSDLVPFSPYTGDPPEDPQFVLEGEESEQETMIDLMLLGFRRILENIDNSDDSTSNLNENPRGHKQDAGNEKDGLYYFWEEIRNTNIVHRQHWKRHVRNWINCLNEDHYNYIRNHFQYKGTPLREMGFWNLIASVLSHMATVKLRDWGSFYHLLGDNPNAAEWFIFWLRAFKTSNSLMGIRGGMDWIIIKLCEDLKIPRNNMQQNVDTENVDIKFGHKLMRIEENPKLKDKNDKDHIDKNIVLLKFKTDDTPWEEFKAKQVILALPKGPLKNLVFEGAEPRWIEKFEQLLETVAPIPLLKCFFLVDRPFWEDNRPANRYAHTIPTREVHYWKNINKDTGLIMLYTDNPGHEFWSNYLHSHHKITASDSDPLFNLNLPERKQKEANSFIWTSNPGGQAKDWEHFSNGRLLRTFISYVRENHSDSVPDNQILAASIRDWSLKPAKGATHFWRPGIDIEKVIDYLKAFSFKGDNSQKIHICGEAYSDYQGFIEGALRSADKILKLPYFQEHTDKTKTASLEANIALSNKIRTSFPK